MKTVNNTNECTMVRPKQPEFVLVTSGYWKNIVMMNNIAHFYRFNAETDRMNVIPDACVDILFHIAEGDTVARIAGSCLEKRTITTYGSGEYFGVRFMPGVNPVGDKLKPDELVDGQFNYADFINPEDKSKLFEGIYNAGSFDKRIEIFMSFYLKSAAESVGGRYDLNYFIRNELINSAGTVRFSDLCEKTGYSERYINKKINEDFGISPKKLMRFIRFQKAVDNLTDTIGKADLKADCIGTALDTGYYDQSHFINEFKQLSGYTPKHYIKNLTEHYYNEKLHVIS